jgi:rhodanese-related sulfurtransferase
MAEPAVLLDVRTADEFAMGHLAGAVNLDISSRTFFDGVRGLDRSAGYAVYCLSGARSRAAVQVLQAAGFATVRDLGPLGAARSATGREVIR